LSINTSRIIVKEENTVVKVRKIRSSLQSILGMPHIREPGSLNRKAIKSIVKEAVMWQATGKVMQQQCLVLGGLWQGAKMNAFCCVLLKPLDIDIIVNVDQQKNV